MTQYVLVDPVTGEQTTLSEAELTRNLQLNCILLQGREHIGIITHRDLVSFSRWCAGEALARSGREPDQSVTHALSLVDRWLEDEKSITSEELEAAAWAARVARAAAWAARAAWAAAAADAGATWAAAEAARAAGAAARAARAAEATSYEVQAKWLVEHLQSGK